MAGTTEGAGAGAREVHARLVAARLRKLQAQGATADELVAALDDAPAHETAWALGAEGEETVGRVLDEWAQVCGFAVLHDLTLPGHGGNIDHLVVGAGGVTVIDTKAWTGDVRASAKGLRIRGWGKRKTLEGLTAQADLVRGQLVSHGVDAVVCGALCMANRNDGLERHEVARAGHHVVGTPEAVARFVARGTGCSRDDAAVAVQAVIAAFRARAVTPLGDLLVIDPGPAAPVTRTKTPPPRAPARPRSPKRRPRRRSRMWILGELGSAAAALALIAGMLHALPSNAPAARLTKADVKRVEPVLRARARAAADGRVRSPHVTMTRDEARLVYHRGSCRVTVLVDRRAPADPLGARVLRGRSCGP